MLNTENDVLSDWEKAEEPEVVSDLKPPERKAVAKKESSVIPEYLNTKFDNEELERRRLRKLEKIRDRQLAGDLLGDCEPYRSEDDSEPELIELAKANHAESLEKRKPKKPEEFVIKLERHGDVLTLLGKLVPELQSTRVSSQSLLHLMLTLLDTTVPRFSNVELNTLKQRVTKLITQSESANRIRANASRKNNELDINPRSYLKEYDICYGDSESEEDLK